MSGPGRIAVVVVAAVVAGCANLVVQHGGTGGSRPPASAGGPKSPLVLPAARPCPGQSCPTLEIDFAGGCPDVVLDTIEFRGGQGRRNLTWKIINPSGWRFSQQPLMPAFHFTGKNGSPVPADRVGTPTFPDETTLVLAWDRKGDGATPPERGRFEYALNFVGPDGKTCTIDPWIVDR